MGRSRAWTGIGRDIFRVVRTGWRVIGNADRGIFVTITELKPGGAEHTANTADELLPDALTHARALSIVVLDCRQSIEFSVFGVEISRQPYISYADRTAFGIVGGE